MPYMVTFRYNERDDQGEKFEGSMGEAKVFADFKLKEDREVIFAEIRSKDGKELFSRTPDSAWERG